MTLDLKYTVWLLVAACCGLLTACDGAPEDSLPVTSIAVSPDCQIESGCAASSEGLSLVVQFGAVPRALQPFPVSLKLIGIENVREIYVTFVMQGMDMGLNRYRLYGDSMSAWKADVTLPICLSGRSDWIAEFELLLADRRVVLQIPFVLSN